MNKAVKTVSFIAAATMLSKIMGMLRDMVLAGSYGTGAQLDAYMAASRIPLLFFDFTLGAAILSTFIPVFNRYLQKGEHEKAEDFSNSFINLVILIAAVFCVIGIVFSKQLTGIIAPGYPEEIKLLTSNLLVIMLPTVILTTLAYAFVGILQSLGEFNIPALISLVSNAAVIFYLVFLNRYFGIYGLAVAMLVGWSLQVIIQIPSLIKKKYRYKPVLNLKNSGIRDVFMLAVPILISSWLQPICVLVNTVFASFMPEGSVAALELANRLYIILVGVFVYAITNYIFPALSKLSGGGDGEGFANIMEKSLRSMIVIIAPIMAGMVLFSREIITVVYGRGEFNETSIALTSTALFFYTMGMIGYGTNEILSKCFYAMKDGKTPMIASVFGIVTVIALAFLFTNFLHAGVGGLALSASVSSYVVSCVLLYKMHKKTASLFKRDNLIFIGKIAICVVAAVFAAIALKAVVSPYGIWITLAASSVAAAAIYFFGIVILKIYTKGMITGND